MSSTHVTIKIPKELVDEMDRLLGKHGFRSRGEIAKEALRQFLAKYENEINLRKSRKEG
jgi:metal-responsive CopG/Arc/MetJ family transcriptional regulator